jgi:hypothetical protein
LIVEPDFLTHWKTRALILALDDQAAGVYVLSLWAHCQNRKTDRFNLTASRFAQVCSYPCPAEADKFLAAMIECGWIDRDGDTLIAHGWAEANAKMYANWQNGMFGGRKPNPQRTQQEPNTENHELASTDKSRVDKIREKSRANGSPSAAISDEDWLKQLATESCYAHIRVLEEYGKMQVWCRQNKREPTRRRFVNWLNRIERPLSGAVQQSPHKPKREIPERYRSFLLEKYPAKRDQIATWKTWEQLPAALQCDWQEFKKGNV